MASFFTYLAVVDSFVKEYAFVQAQVVDYVKAGEATDQELGYIVARFTDLRSRVHSFNKSFDEVDILVYEGSPDPVRRLELWHAEKELRARMSKFSQALAESIRVATALIDKTTDLVVIARDTDTYQSIAARELGDWRAWVDLHQANRTQAAPGEVLTGKPLVVPRRG